MIQHSQYSFSA